MSRSFIRQSNVGAEGVVNNEEVSGVLVTCKCLYMQTRFTRAILETMTCYICIVLVPDISLQVIQRSNVFS